MHFDCILIIFPTAVKSVYFLCVQEYNHWTIKIPNHKNYKKTIKKWDFISIVYSIPIPMMYCCDFKGNYFVLRPYEIVY
jgi:hypothetical protein